MDPPVKRSRINGDTMKRIVSIAIVGLAACGCEKMAKAPESPGTNHLIQLVDSQIGVVGAPDYWILRDSRTGDEYLAVANGSSSMSVTPMRRKIFK